jgi:hypothetical protein
MHNPLEEVPAALPGAGPMAVFHLHAGHLKKGHGSAADFAQYIARDGRDQASQIYRYIDREMDGRASPQPGLTSDKLREIER